MQKTMTVVLLAVVSVGCQQTTPLEPSATAAGAAGAHAGNGIVMSATGDGTYDAGVPVTFSMNALAKAAGSAKGEFRHTATLGGQLVDFTGRVTCLAVDPANQRAWIGGVVTTNNSTHPNFTTAIHQVGRDVWFRVHDNGEGGGAVDRSTFLGFEGAAGIITSAEYCQARIWPNDGSPFLTGNLQIRP